MGGLTVGYGAIGSATIDAANASAEDIWLGSTNGGDGSVLVTTGITLSLTGSYDGIGNGSGGIGSATITGVGSLWNSVGAVSVGNLGTGSLLVSAGGSFEASGGLTVGYEGSGQVSITGGGVVNVGTDTTIGQAGGTGTVTVDGAGSTLDATTWLGVGFDGVGNLTISNGGLVEVDISGQSLADQGYSQIGHGTAADGSIVTVTGAGSELKINGAIGVGWTGARRTGTCWPPDWSAFIAPSMSDFDSMDIGNSATGTGIVRVTGGTIEAGSKTTASWSACMVPGSLEVSAGGSVDAQSGLLEAVDAGSTGTVSVDGAGSTLSIGNYFVIGGGPSAGWYRHRLSD